MVDKREFGKLPNGDTAYLVTLENNNGIRVKVTNYGAKLVSILVPDRNGFRDNVILGYNSLEHYLDGHPYLGATIGRVANRIANASFNLNGQTVNLSKNLENNHLHGGAIGFESLLWEVLDVNENADEPSVSMLLKSPDGDQGYPGNLKVIVKYSLVENSVKIDFEAITDKPTIVNLTNHAYFNLNPIYCENIYRHRAKFLASSFLETNSELIPTGTLLKVENTPLDFKEFKEIGQEINTAEAPVFNTNGFDQYLVVDDFEPNKLSLMAEVEEPISGRVLQVLSTLPGMQFYTSNFLDTVYPTGYGGVNSRHSSFCLEPSYFTDAPNHSNFKGIVLSEKQKYNETIVFNFLTR